jgi:hypothetical protein
LSNQQWPQQLKPNSLLETRADSKSLLNFVSAKLWSGGTYEARLRRGYIADVTFKDPANEKRQIPGRQLLRGQTYKALITNIRQLRSNDIITPFN